MRTFLRILAAALPLLLAACAPAPAVRVKGDAALLNEQEARERVLAGTDHWVLQGKLGISDGKNGGSGTLNWSQDGEHYEFTVRSPVVGKSFRISDSASGPRRGPSFTPFSRAPSGPSLRRKLLPTIGERTVNS